MARHRAAPMLLLFAAVLFFNVSRVCTQQIEIPKGTNNGPTPYVGAYYFNWYNLEDQWTRYSQTRHPVLGHYDQSDPQVLQKHHEWAKMGGIDFFAMAWSGGGSELVQWPRADEIDRRVTSHLKLTDGVKVALMYNIRDFVQAGSHGKIDLAAENYCEIISDHLVYAAHQHFSQDNYFKIGENPVIFLYTLRDYVNYVDCIQLALERMLLETGVVPYIIGDTVWWSPGATKFDWDDFRSINVSAVTAFSTYDAGQPHRMGHNFAWDNAQLFHDMISSAWSKKMIVVPSILPGFDDRHMRGAKRPFIDRAHGAELVQQWKQVLWYPMCQTKLVNTMRFFTRVLDNFDFGVKKEATIAANGKTAMIAKGSAQVSPPMIMINSFNEWHDGTEIEPSTEEGEDLLKLIAQLKAEVANEELQCGKEKDKNFRAPKFLVPKQFMDPQLTPADKVFVMGMSIVMWFFLMWVTWVCFGHVLLHHTGRAPTKYKDDDLGGGGRDAGGFADFAPTCVPTEMFMTPVHGKYPKRVPTMWTFGTLVATGVLSFTAITFFFNHSPVIRWFDDRAHQWERRGHSNVRRAREVAHMLCPTLVLNLHKAKFEEWIRKLAANQVSQLEFRNEMCGEKGLHTKEIEAMYLELLGREPEESGLLHYEKQVEEGKMTLADVRMAIQNSPESTDWQQMTQARRTKVSRYIMDPVRGIKDAVKKLHASSASDTSADRGTVLSAHEVIQHRVQELMKEGKNQEAQALLREYRSTGEGPNVLKHRPRKMNDEEGSHHDTLMDDWDVA